MRNLAKTLIMMATVVMSLVFGVSSVDAKEYKGYSAGYGHGVNVDRPGYAEFVNYGLQEISTDSGYTMYYNLKEASNVKSVKAPTMSSKKLRPGKAKQFIIKKNSVLKFKVIKGKVTKAKFKKAKTYYVVMKVNKNVPFTSVKSGTSFVLSETGYLEGIKFDHDAASDFYFTNDGTKPTKRNDIGRDKAFNVTKDCTIKVSGYQYGHYLGTYTYKVTLKRYTNKVTNPYRLPEVSDLYAVPTASTDLELEMEVSCKGADLTKGEDAQRTGRLMQSIVTVKQYQKVYYKENGKLVQCGRKLYSTETKKYNTGLPVKKVYTDKCYAGYCLTEEEHPGITAMRITYVDTDGYLVTEVVAPGERMKGEMMYGAYFEFQIAGEWHFTTDRARCEDFARDDSDHWGVDNFMRTLKGEKIKLY